MLIGIIGSTGMAGSMIYSYLTDRGHTVVGYSRKILSGYTDKLLTLHNSEQLDNLHMWILSHHPDAIINCTGVLVKESQNNPAEAIYVNSYFPHLLESMTKGTDTKVIHLSTDCIFNGLDDYPYYEDSLPNETGWYGRSKALGEVNNSKDLTLRQSIIGPAPQVNNTGLLNWMLTQKEVIVKGYTQAMWNGITTLELAKNIERILMHQPQLSGIYHLIPDGTISKFDLLVLIRNVWDLDTTIEPSLDGTCYKILVNTRTDFPIIIPGYEEQIVELNHYMKEHHIEVAHRK